LKQRYVPHILAMFVCNLLIAFSSMEALEATVGESAYSITFQISRALAATIIPVAIAMIPVYAYDKLRNNQIAVIIVMWFAWAGLGAIPLAGALLGELGDGFSLISYNWLPAL